MEGVFNETVKVSDRFGDSSLSTSVWWYIDDKKICGLVVEQAVAFFKLTNPTVAELREVVNKCVTNSLEVAS
jgi:hypothetical protein